MKKIYVLSALISASILNLKAQQVKSDGPALSISAGVTMPNSETKNAYNMGNLTNFNLGLYVPLFNFGQADRLSNIGLNLAGEYFIGNRDYNTSTSAPFNIMGQQSNPTIAAKGSGSPKQQGFKNEGGVQANISVGPIVLSPVINVGYLNFRQKAYSIKQTSPINGQNKEVELYSQSASKNTGLSFNPKLRASRKYKFGRDTRIAVFAEGSYTAGPTIETQTTTFRPNGSPDAKGMYNIDQISSGKNTAAQTSTKFNSFGVNVGLTFSWIKAAFDKGRTSNPSPPQNQSVVNTTKSNTKDLIALNPDRLDSLNTGNPNQPQNQSIVNTTKSNTKDRTVNPDRMEVKYNGLEKSLGKMKLSVLGSGVTLADGTPVVMGKVVSGQITGIAAPIRITIKQAASGDEGISMTDQLGKFTVTLGHDTVHKIYVNDKEFGKIKIESNTEGDAFRKGWDGTVKGGSKIAIPNEEVNGYRKGWDGTVKGGSKKVNPRDDGNAGTQKSSTEHMSPLYKANAIYESFVAGQPIGGIIVKGGRNPGGSMITTATNTNGEFGFEVKEGGDHLFLFTASPELAANASARRAAKRAAQQTKPAHAEVKNPVYEGGGSTDISTNYENFVAGEPIGGIVVKGGRNPGGSMLVFTPTANGEILLKNLAPGNYKFIATAPTPNGKGITQSGIK